MRQDIYVGRNIYKSWLTSIFLSILLFLVLPAVSYAYSLSLVPASGTDTSDGSFDVTNVQYDDAIRDKYSAPDYAYDESLYQEYLFNYHLCSTATINSVTVTLFNWMVKRTPAAKLEVFNHAGGSASYSLNPPNTNGTTSSTVDISDIITTPEDVNSLKIRFLAYGGTTPQIDYVLVTVNYSDSNVCITPDNFSYTAAGSTASYSHLITADPNTTINLSSTSDNGWPVRMYQGTGSINIDGSFSVSKTGGTVSQVTTDANGDAYLVVETDVQTGSQDDVATITATGAASSSSATDTSVMPADGIKDPEYSAPYAIREFFDYGPDPNRASGEVYRYVKDGIMHIYYAQNPRNINDNTYGTWAQAGWGTGGHTLDTDLTNSDKTEFIFYDENGNIKLDFFSDYVSTITPTAEYPGGYHSCGFMTPCSDGSASDGSMVLNNTAFSDSQLANLVSVESSAAYNINHYTPTVGGNAIVDCGSYGNVDLTLNSPPINTTNYDLLCPNASDFQFSYAIEIVLPMDKIFPNEPALTVVARAHNSPNKNGDRDNPPTPSSASIGDYVWYDMNGDGVQDSWETGIPNVRVVLYWDKNGDGLFSPDEELTETRTDENGLYLFDGIYGGQFWSKNEGMTIDDGQYKVWVDESTIPPGFVRTPAIPNPYVLSDTIPGACTLTQYGGQTDCTGNGGTWTATSRGSLAYDEACRTADFGYMPNGGVIGDFVWFDANDNGIEDAGEVGIAGVTLNLLDSASGTVLGTTTTNSEGRYYFTGLAAGTYKVQVTDTAGVLAGYTHTLGNDSLTTPTQNIVLGTNGVVLYADFGYYTDTTCATGDVSGQVFFDQNWDKTFDGTDTGLSNVGVSIWQDANGNGLLDDTDPSVGSTKTDSSGNFHFSGLPVSSGGVGYILQVTNDPSGLSKFYPGGGDVVTLTSSACGASADFPYVGAGVIGDFVWNDLNHNGIQDAGEPGIGGVTVQANYCSPATPAPGCDNTFTFNAVTDSTGHYMFNGLRTTDTSGNAGARYRVNITDTGNVLNGWTASPQLQGGDATLDSNNPAGTDVTLGTGGASSFSDVTNDFGYYNATAVFGSIGDYIWEDTNGNGLEDEGAGFGFNGVTIDLRDANGNTIATTTTSGDGAYLFQGLPTSDAGTQYHVVITDLNGVLNGYSMTTNPDALNVTLTTAAPDVLTADAGYQYRPKKAVLSSFRAYPEGGRVTVQWQTVSEIDTAGFYLFRYDPKAGRYRQINSVMLPALVGSPQGGTYRLTDNGASPSEDNSYLLVEVETRGKQKIFGPFRMEGAPADLLPSAHERLMTAVAVPHRTVSIEKSIRSSVSGFSSQPHAGRRTPATDPAFGASRNFVQGSVSKPPVGGGSFQPIKIPVTESGLYYFDAAKIAGMLGMATEDVAQMIQHGQLSLSNRGNRVSYEAADGGSGLFFYGEAIDSPYTEQNIYWLTKGPGLGMAAETLPAVSGETPAVSFAKTLHFDQDNFTAAGMFTDPSADYWFWDYVEAGYPGLDSKSFTLHVDGVAPWEGEATLVIDLQGATDTPASPDHHAIITLNGVGIGQSSWDGATDDRITLSFSQGLLKEGDNTVVISGVLDSDVPYSIFYVNSFDLSYQRLYRATGDRLLFRGDGSSVVSVSGFTSPDIEVYDVSAPGNPVAVTPLEIDGGPGDYSVTFSPASPENEYLAVSLAAAMPVTGAWVRPAKRFNWKANSADYVIITVPQLKAATDGLAQYREGQGLRTMVVPLEDVMDAFNYGIYNPEAIKTFLANACYKWDRPPRYVLLAGNGTYDYKDHMGYGDNLVPPMMVGTPNGLFSSDNYYADVNNDYFPEMAVGRLPAVTSGEMRDMVNKIIAYENSGGLWEGNVMMLADKPDDSGNYPADSDTVASLLPAAFTPDKIYLSQHPIDDARNLVLNGINGGAAVINYTGHGGVDRLAQDGLLMSSDLPSLTNADRLPFLTAMTCVLAQFDIPGYDTLGESLVLKPGGGAIAIWSPTGMSINFQGDIVDKALFNSIFVEKQAVLGEAVLESLGNYMKSGNDPYLIDIFGLIGDPALRLR